MAPEPQSVPAAIATEPQKIGKFKASKMLVRESLNVLKQDKELAWFPVLTTITSLVALVAFMAAFFFFVMQGDIHMLDNADSRQADIIGYVALFVYYLMMMFIANYFLAGVYTIVKGRFSGKNLSFSDGMANASKHASKIFVWSLISATVGVILRIISDKSALIGKIVAGLFGAAWGILTYFSLPSLVIGERTIKESFKESASVIRKTWGETIIVNFGISLFLGLLSFLVFAVAIGIAIIIPSTGMIVTLALLLFIYILAVSIVGSTLGSIIKLALYEYATTGVVPLGFTPDLIKGAVKAGK